jgi:surface antigen
MRSKLLISACLLSVAATSHAGNLSFLANTVISEFSDTEAVSFKQFVGKQLNTLSDQEKALWKSEESSLQGIVRPSVTFKQDGITCRQTRFSLKGKGDKKMFFNFDVCKLDGLWKIKQSPLARFKQKDWDALNLQLTEVLNDGEDGFPVSWSMHHLGVTGTIVPLNQTSKQDKTCRDAAISVADNKGHTSSGRYEFCFQDGEWSRTIN